MVNSILSEKAVEVMKNALNISAERNRLITSNIANADTVGYAPTDLDFKETLLNTISQSHENTLTRTHADHLPADTMNDAKTVYLKGTAAVVDIDQEMVNLAENNIQYRTCTEMLTRKLAILKYAITEGGK